jgi:acid phosphatase
MITTPSFLGTAHLECDDVLGAELVEPRTPASVKGHRPVKKYLSLLAAILTIATAPIYSVGQQSVAPKPQQPVFSVNAPAERILNLDVLKKQLEQYHDCTCKCGCYTHDIDIQADRAIAFLRRRAAHHNPQEKLAMVFDIDETTLSNYPEMLAAGFAFESRAFDAWVQTAKAPAISGSLRLYKEAQRLGVSVFFITGRHEAERDATEHNLRAEGFENWQQLTLRPASGGSETTSEYKSAARAQIVAEGYRIVLNVGDQWSDLKGKPEAEFSVKYPDPYYFLP